MTQDRSAHALAVSLTYGWTPEREGVLRKLWADGRSAADIARTLGSITRSSVIGKARRLGLEPHSTYTRKLNHNRAMRVRAMRQPKPVKAPKPPPAPKPPTPVTIRLRTFPMRTIVIAEPAALPPMRTVDTGPGKLWLERAFGECAYPVSGDGADTFSCCAPIEGEGSYCGAHRAIMFVPQKPARKTSDRLWSQQGRRWAA